MPQVHSMSRFKTRSTQPEWMDTQATTLEEFHDCLQTLEKINVCTLAYPPTLNWFRSLCATNKVKGKVSLWDVGSGGGDMLRRIWKLSGRRGVEVQLTGIDLHPLAEQSARISTPDSMGIRYSISNIFDVPEEEKTDLIMSSLFTHHLSDDELVRFIQWMEQHATAGWFINDLHRHPVAFYFIKYTVQWLGLNRLVVHDAPVSVARAFTRKEWEQLLVQAGVPLEAVEVKWFFPFRYCVSRIKS